MKIALFTSALFLLVYLYYVLTWVNQKIYPYKTLSLPLWVYKTFNSLYFPVLTISIIIFFLENSIDYKNMLILIVIYPFFYIIASFEGVRYLIFKDEMTIEEETLIFYNGFGDPIIRSIIKQLCRKVAQESKNIPEFMKNQILDKGNENKLEAFLDELEGTDMYITPRTYKNVFENYLKNENK